MIIAPKRGPHDSCAVTFRKARLGKQRMLSFSPQLAREAGLEGCAYVAFMLVEDEVRLRPMVRSRVMGQQIHRIAKDGKREHAAIWTRQEILPEKLFPSGRYPARLEKGWIVVSMPGAEKKYRQHHQLAKTCPPDDAAGTLGP